MTDNEALNAIVDELEAIVGIVGEDYDSIVSGTEATATPGNPVTRAADSTAVRTLVVCPSGDDVQIRITEDGNFIATVTAGSVTALPLKGKGLISVEPVTGSAVIQIVTYQRA